MSKAQHLKVDILQGHIKWHDPQNNYKTFDRLVSESLNPDIILLPEMWSTGFTMKAHLFDSEIENSIELMKKWSVNKSSVVIGSVIAKEGDRYFNRLYCFEKGQYISHYDKRHLFGFSGEDISFDRGEKKVIAKLRSWDFCLNICYDLRFPAWSRNLEDYDVLIYSANWPDVRIDAWQSLLKARAIENQCFVLGANCYGEDAWHNRYSGHSRVLSYDGSALTANTPGEAVLSAQLNLEDMMAFRRKFPFLNDRDEFTMDS